MHFIIYQDFLYVNNMKLEKAKEFLAERGINVKTKLEGAYASKYKLSELLTEFAQQNTLTLNSKVDNEPYVNSIENRIQFKVQNCIDIRTINGAEVYDLKELRDMINIYLFNIKQRLDNEKRLREGIEKVIEEGSEIDNFESAWIINALEKLLNND